MRANNQDWWSSWMLWLFVVAVMMLPPQRMNSQIKNSILHLGQATVAVLAYEADRELFPWLPRWRWKKLALARYRRWQATYRKMRRCLWLARQIAGLAQIGSISMAALVDFLTRAQWQRQLGAIVVLYPLLKELRVEEIINKHLPSHHQVKHGPVAMVLILS
ncbi:MAG: hypothetical protein GY805_37040 [Chloroflexi bacterium]|nr:hypothetical protein [Chloroflexota bacterium]